jgi:hypothetical protein
MSQETTILAPEQVEEIRQRAEKATPGPWETRFMYRMWHAVRTNARSLGLLLQSKDNDWADSDFTAHARTDVPALVTSHEALRAEVERLRQIARYSKEMVDYVADTLPQRNCDADEPSSFPLMRCWVSEAMVVQARDIQRAIADIKPARTPSVDTQEER